MASQSSQQTNQRTLDCDDHRKRQKENSINEKTLGKDGVIHFNDNK